MCGRYYVDIDVDIVLGEIYESVWRETVMNGARQRDIYPTNLAAVLSAGEGEFGLVLPAVWGFRAEKRLLINARAETVLSRKTFSRPFYETRCVVPASGFYEWTGDKKTKQRYTIRGEEGPLYFAGLLDTVDDTLCFVILTRASVGSMIPVHSRQPVTLPSGQLHDYLTDVDAAKALILEPGVSLYPEKDDSMGPLQISFFD